MFILSYSHRYSHRILRMHLVHFSRTLFRKFSCTLLPTNYFIFCVISQFNKPRSWVPVVPRGYLVDEFVEFHVRFSVGLLEILQIHVVNVHGRGKRTHFFWVQQIVWLIWLESVCFFHFALSLSELLLFLGLWTEGSIQRLSFKST